VKDGNAREGRRGARSLRFGRDGYGYVQEVVQVCARHVQGARVVQAPLAGRATLAVRAARTRCCCCGRYACACTVTPPRLARDDRQKDKPLGSEPWFNPEGVTAAKVGRAAARRAHGARGVDRRRQLAVRTWRGRAGPSALRARQQGRAPQHAPVSAPPPATQREWLEAQHAQQQGVARPQWPPKIFENFFVVVSRGRGCQARAGGAPPPLLRWRRAASESELRPFACGRAAAAMPGWRRRRGGAPAPHPPPGPAARRRDHSDRRAAVR
jgi:hypothetical protein